MFPLSCLWKWCVNLTKASQWVVSLICTCPFGIRTNVLLGSVFRFVHYFLPTSYYIEVILQIVSHQMHYVQVYRARGKSLLDWTV